MNRRGVVDFGFLGYMNGGPGVIHPDLDAALSPDIKLAWFRHVADRLQILPPDEAVALLAGAVLPFEHTGMNQCRAWQDLAPVAAALADTNNNQEAGGEAGDTLKTQIEGMHQQALTGLKNCRIALEEWIAAADESLPPAPAAANAGRRELNEYESLKSAWQAQSEELRLLQEHATVLFGEAPVYVPPVVILRKFMEAESPPGPASAAR
jgi:hypothetical protein